MNCVVVSGSPREQGRAHGLAARGDIAENLHMIRQGMAMLSARGRSYDYNELLSKNEAFVAREAPEILDEVRGIAEGAEVPYQDLLFLNLPLYFIGILMPQECSQILISPPATCDDKTYLAKTRDMGQGKLKHVALHRRYSDGRELLEVNVAGSITWPGSGISSDGLLLSTSGVWSRRTEINLERVDSGWLLANGHLLLRDSRSLDDLAARAELQPRVTGINMVAADQQKAAAFELTADRLFRQDAEAGTVVRTNHYLTPALQHLSPTPEEYPSTYHRYEVATKRIREAHGRWDGAALASLIASHEGYPQLSLCRHSEGDQGADTIYASIATLPDGGLLAIQGNPCQA
jgi:isopenicillin-N N-acyltransferase-like protein